jgi:hypothetical protein
MSLWVHLHIKKVGAFKVIIALLHPVHKFGILIIGEIFHPYYYRTLSD